MGGKVEGVRRKGERGREGEEEYGRGRSERREGEGKGCRVIGDEVEMGRGEGGRGKNK